LNSHFNCLVPAIVDHGGEVLKFIGDGLLAVFQTGAGRNHAQVSEAAVQATIDACREMAKLNEERHAAGAPPLSFGLALNFGQIHYGNIGAADLLDFTAIGPAVNLAARMEAIAAENGRDIVVSSEIQADLNMETESLGDFSVKGFSERVAIYAVPDNLLDQSP
jgi:class 3 adenylate cyclase